MTDHKPEPLVDQLEAMDHLITRAERQATPLHLSSRLRELRASQQQLHRVAQGNQLPCPHCGDWGDLSNPTCQACGKPMSLDGITARTGLWMLYLLYAIAFSGVVVGCSLVVLAPQHQPWLRSISVLPLLAALKLAGMNWARLARALAWVLHHPKP